MPSSDQGVNLDRYLLVPRTLIFLVKGDCILFLKGGPEKRLWSGMYNGLGGHVERGEDIISAAYRELEAAWYQAAKAAPPNVSVFAVLCEPRVPTKRALVIVEGAGLLRSVSRCQGLVVMRLDGFRGQLALETMLLARKSR